MFIGSIVLIVLLLLAYYWYAMSNKVETPSNTTVTVSETDHMRGAKGGKVTIVEFGDLQCPACAAYEPLVRKVLEDNPTTTQLVFKHFPLTQIHSNALIAAKASESAALQGKFWEMHDMLYDRQSEWQAALNAREIFTNYATTLSLDVAKFTAGLDNKEVEDKILAEYKEGVSLGVQGTPTFFINGKKIENPRSAEELDALVKAEATK